jgi:hypothetical protein
MEKEFKKVLKDCEEKFNSKEKKYGDSWKNMSIQQLMDRFYEELEELEHVENRDEEYEETIDVINCALMLSARIKQDVNYTK